MSGGGLRYFLAKLDLEIFSTVKLRKYLAQHIHHHRCSFLYMLAWKTFWFIERKWLIWPSPVLTVKCSRGATLIRSVSLVLVGVECCLIITSDGVLHVKGVKTWTSEVIFKRCLTSNPHTLGVARWHSSDLPIPPINRILLAYQVQS